MIMVGIHESPAQLSVYAIIRILFESDGIKIIWPKAFVDNIIEPMCRLETSIEAKVASLLFFISLCNV